MYKPISETHADEMLSDNTQIQYCKQCKNCENWNGGDAFSNRFDKSSCKVYEYPDCKPVGVINNHEICRFRVVKE